MEDDEHRRLRGSNHSPASTEYTRTSQHAEGTATLLEQQLGQLPGRENTVLLVVCTTTDKTTEIY